MTEKQPKTFMIKPFPGFRIKDPLTFKVLKDEGELKPRNSYWLRRLKKKDCVLVEPKAPKAKTQTKKDQV